MGICLDAMICCYEKKKNIEGKKIEALELSTTVVRLELYMHILLSNAGTYGDVLFAFSMHGTPKKILGLAAASSRLSIWHAMPYRCQPAAGGFLPHALFVDSPVRLRRPSKAKHERLRFNPEKLYFATWPFVVPKKIKRSKGRQRTDEEGLIQDKS